MKTAAGTNLSSITLSTPASPPPAPAGKVVIFVTDLAPTGAAFSPSITISAGYDESNLPPGASESGLVLAFWDGQKWTELESTVDTAANVVSAKVSHFTVFGILADAGATAVPTDSPSTTTSVPVPATTTPVLTQEPAVTQSPTSPATPITSSPTQSDTGSTNWPLIAGIGIVGAITVIGFVVFLSRRGSKQTPS